MIVSGAVFIVLGIIPWLSKDKEENPKPFKKSKSLPLFACFSLVSLMELGDKTQIMAITLAR